MERSTVRDIGERMLGWVLVGILTLLPCLAFAFYYLFVESLQVNFESDRINFQYELVSDAAGVGIGQTIVSNGNSVFVARGPMGVGPREFVLKISWILYCVAGLVGIGLVGLIIRKRMKVKSKAILTDGVEGTEQWLLWRPRFQFSLRTFLIAALLFGAVFPASLYRARTLLQRRRMLSMGYVVMSADFTDKQRAAAERHTSFDSLWKTLTYFPNSRWGKPRHLDIVSPKSSTQNYRVININPDVQRDQLVIVEAKLGTGASGCSLDLFSSDADLTGSPKEQDAVRVQRSKVRLYDLYPNGEGMMLFPIKPGESFQLGVTGNWGMRNTKNEVELTIRVDDY